MGRPPGHSPGVADIFRACGAAWRKANAGHVSFAQLKVMSAIETCRTAALGGHVERCNDCAHVEIAYNSCRNRHCPKCQGAAARQWLEAQRDDPLTKPAGRSRRFSMQKPSPREAGRRFCNLAVAVRNPSTYPRVCPAHKVVRRGVLSLAAALALVQANQRKSGEWWPGMTKPSPGHYSLGRCARACASVVQ